MAENTKIQWTNHTFNPWWGCTKISPACDHCYAADWAKRFRKGRLWEGARERKGAVSWDGPVKWNRKAAARGIRLRVFCASMADVFDNQAPHEWRSDLWRLIEDTPHLDWLLLTKRPQLVRRMAPGRDWSGWGHIWLGATVENQEEADRRISHLLNTPARTRFLSCEPLLEAIEPDLSGIHWVICGGESGSKDKARMMDPAWARRLRDQCSAAGVAFFMKQMTREAPIPPDLMVRQYPKPVRAKDSDRDLFDEPSDLFNQSTSRLGQQRNPMLKDLDDLSRQR
jgi:protein gp37